MSDVWEGAYFGGGALPEADSDSDNQRNREESVAGTDPNLDQSVLRVETIELLENARLVRWQSVAGKRYQVEGTLSVTNAAWMPVGDPVEGTGEEVLAAISQTVPVAAFRLHVLENNPAIASARSDLENMDSDGDGSADIDEFVAGTNPLDENALLRIDSMTNGPAAVLRWSSVVAKHYLVESCRDLQTHNWTAVGGVLTGTGLPMRVAVERDGTQEFWRVKVFDEDDDQDGLSDWEETFTGLDHGPRGYRTAHPSDPGDLPPLLSPSNVVSIEIGAATANVTRGLPGSFVVRREGGLDSIIVNYTVGGNAEPGIDYAALPGSVTLPPGAISVEIPVIPMDGNVMLSRSVIVTLQNDPAYLPGTNIESEVRLVREVPLDVTDFGAVGDGLIDDTVAIQAAITALGTSTSHNTLHFPPGIYRLNTPTFDPNPLTSNYRLLVLGENDIADRDLVFTGEEGAILYSTVSSLRVPMLVVHAGFRTLAFHGLTWKKDSNPLPATGGSPNGATGVDLIRYDLHRVEGVDFLDCTFDNCHAAVSTSFHNGYDARGKLAHFGFKRCRVVNPYGSNTINGQNSFGGGQQVRLSPWVGTAIYENNYFDGGGEEPLDLSKNPGRIRKDGSHFGSPLKLLFTNNVVRHMMVEAVHQFDDPFMGNNSHPFTIPPVDGTSTVQVVIQPIASTFEAGQVLNFRVGLTPTTQGFNALLTVAAFDSTNRTLTLKNEGFVQGLEGENVPTGVDIYLQTYNPTIATITGNVITSEATNPRGDIGMVTNARATIAGNYISGYVTGIYLYENVRNPFNPPTPGTLIDSNVILTRDPRVGLPFAFGIDTYGPGDIISHNLIVSPASAGFVGILPRTTNTWVEANTVLP